MNVARSPSRSISNRDRASRSRNGTCAEPGEDTPAKLLLCQHPVFVAGSRGDGVSVLSNTIPDCPPATVMVERRGDHASGVRARERPELGGVREHLLEALSADAEGFNDPRRFELIAWFLQNNPRHHICSTPFAHVDPETAPGAYGDLKARWICASVSSSRSLSR